MAVLFQFIWIPLPFFSLPLISIPMLFNVSSGSGSRGVDLRRCALDLASRPTQPRRAPARLDRPSLDELRRGPIEPASTSFDEARSTQPRRAPARLDRASLDELRRGSIDAASTIFDETGSTQLQLRRGSIDPASTSFDEARSKRPSRLARLRRTSMLENV